MSQVLKKGSLTTNEKIFYGPAICLDELTDVDVYEVNSDSDFHKLQCSIYLVNL